MMERHARPFIAEDIAGSVRVDTRMRAYVLCKISSIEARLVFHAVPTPPNIDL